MVTPYINERSYLVLGNRLITVGGSGGNEVLIYDYPAGTSPIKTISLPIGNTLGITVSVTPSR